MLWEDMLIGSKDRGDELRRRKEVEKGRKMTGECGWGEGRDVLADRVSAERQIFVRVE